MKNSNASFLIGVGFAAHVAFLIAAHFGWGFVAFSALLSVGFFLRSAAQAFATIMAEQLAAKTDEREARTPRYGKALTARAS